VNAKRTALIAGATGVAGRNLLQRLASDEGWDVIAVSRREPNVTGRYTHVPANLLDRADTQAKLGTTLGITHVFYAAYVEGPSLAETVAPNLAMLHNLLDAIEPVSPVLAHIHLMHGTKWYGSHLGPFKTPAREDDQRAAPPNFYYDQMDFIVERQRGKSWHWSSARPHAICGFATGNPMNLVMVLAVYATLCRELDWPFRHPGRLENYQALYQVTDSRLLADAMLWMATAPDCADQAFNITNGDVFRWQYLWPKIAEFFDVPMGEPEPMRLTDAMAGKGDVWDKLAARHGLRAIPYDQLVSWRYGDFAFASGYDIISSTVKSRRYGFLEAVDSEEMFLRLFGELRANRIIP
jgi:nucleoside-diphosphate-sugar epimerase